MTFKRFSYSFETLISYFTISYLNFRVYWNELCQIVGQIFGQIFDQIFDQVFDQIFGQVFDQGSKTPQFAVQFYWDGEIQRSVLLGQEN